MLRKSRKAPYKSWVMALHEKIIAHQRLIKKLDMNARISVADIRNVRDSGAALGKLVDAQLREYEAFLSAAVEAAGGAKGKRKTPDAA